MSCIFTNASPLAETSIAYFYRTPFIIASHPNLNNHPAFVYYVLKKKKNCDRTPENGIYGAAILPWRA
jgi:hypothetical protein